MSDVPDYLKPRVLNVAAGSVPVVQSDATNDLELLSLVVFAAGTVKFTDSRGNDDTWTIPAGAVPYTIPVRMTRVYNTGTSVADADLRGLV